MSVTNGRSSSGLRRRRKRDNRLLSSEMSSQSLSRSSWTASRRSSQCVTERLGTKTVNRRRVQTVPRRKRPSSFCVQKSDSKVSVSAKSLKCSSSDNGISAVMTKMTLESDVDNVACNIFRPPQPPDSRVTHESDGKMFFSPINDVKRQTRTGDGVSSSVLVCIRCRPMNEREDRRGAVCAWKWYC